MHRVIPDPLATTQSVAAALLKLYDESTRATHRAPPRFAAFMAFNDGMRPHEGQLLQSLSRGCGAQIHVSQDIAYYYPNHRYILLDKVAVDRLRELVRLSGDPWVLEPSAEKSKLLKARPLRL